MEILDKLVQLKNKYIAANHLRLLLKELIYLSCGDQNYENSRM